MIFIIPSPSIQLPGGVQNPALSGLELAFSSSSRGEENVYNVIFLLVFSSLKNVAYNDLQQDEICATSLKNKEPKVKFWFASIWNYVTIIECQKKNMIVLSRDNKHQLCHSKAKASSNWMISHCHGLCFENDFCCHDDGTSGNWKSCFYSQGIHKYD